ncbi:MAG: hypothetical protein JWO95_2506 [Verrucomicrobiales bacterium]|nr:hypothetical protein [Verrucomicrobiales bacterium]
MQTKVMIVILLLCASSRRGQPRGFSWLRELTGRQKVFGLLALVVAIVIMANPEFICLGLLGDTAFFDLLVLTLSLQLHGFAVRLGHATIAGVGKWFGWLKLPSPGMAYLMAALTVGMASFGSAVQKLLNRIISS